MDQQSQSQPSWLPPKSIISDGWLVEAAAPPEPPPQVTVKYSPHWGYTCDRVLTSCDLRQEKNQVDYYDNGCSNTDSHGGPSTENLSCNIKVKTESISAHWQLSKYTPWTHTPLKYYTFIQIDHPHILPGISNTDSYLTNLPLHFNSSSCKCSLGVKCFRPNSTASACWLRKTVRRKQQKKTEEGHPTVP